MSSLSQFKRMASGESGSKNGGFTDFITLVDSEAKALEVFKYLKLLNFRQSICVCGNKYLLKSVKKSMKCGFQWVCHSKSHETSYYFNPLANTFFEKSHLNYLKIFDIILHWFYKMPIDLTIVDTKSGENTAVDWNVFCREVCQIAVMNSHEQIGGPGHWVEIDETHLFKRKYKRGHRIIGESVWIFGGVDRNTKKRFMVRVKDRKKRTLWPIIKKNVAPGSILVTDDFKSYTGIDKALHFSAHKVVVHKFSFNNPAFPDVYTNGVESIWAKLKRAVKRAGSNEYVDRYIGEFLYRSKLALRYGKRNHGSKLGQFFADVKKVYPGPNKRGWTLTY